MKRHNGVSQCNGVSQHNCVKQYNRMKPYNGPRWVALGYLRLAG
ncbi:hypothetical protein DJ56_4199 [Yersinia pestis]|nr:hypothetical protein DJ56_4199 [Yersinia pestis]